jgi:ABC-2 type transport system ATP-binding protein
MSIRVNNVSKFYGEQKALNQISFELGKGEIVGFLGPNGAGKTTTMKILTCFLTSDAGSSEVCGFDVQKHPMEVKRRIGYLPEHNPLYLDMYVREYLLFVAGIYSLSKPKRRVEEIVEKTGLLPESRKRIGELSKGYRQRVGLAQALIHDPEVLILDEPTSGLDPNQINEIRELIRETGREKTLLFSTHIMQEVEALCDRVIIINKGQIVADQPAAVLRNFQGRAGATIVVEFNTDVSHAALSALPGVTELRKISPNTWEISSQGTSDLRQEVFRFAVDAGLEVLTLSRREAKLEDVFRELTQNAP